MQLRPQPGIAAAVLQPLHQLRRVSRGEQRRHHGLLQRPPRRRPPAARTDGPCGWRRAPRRPGRVWPRPRWPHLLPAVVGCGVGAGPAVGAPPAVRAAPAAGSTVAGSSGVEVDHAQVGRHLLDEPLGQCGGVADRAADQPVGVDAAEDIGERRSRVRRVRAAATPTPGTRGWPRRPRPARCTAARSTPAAPPPRCAPAVPVRARPRRWPPPRPAARTAWRRRAAGRPGPGRRRAGRRRAPPRWRCRRSSPRPSRSGWSNPGGRRWPTARCDRRRAGRSTPSPSRRRCGCAARRPARAGAGRRPRSTRRPTSRAPRGRRSARCVRGCVPRSARPTTPPDPERGAARAPRTPSSSRPGSTSAAARRPGRASGPRSRSSAPPPPLLALPGITYAARSSAGRGRPRRRRSHRGGGRRGRRTAGTAPRRWRPRRPGPPVGSAALVGRGSTRPVASGRRRLGEVPALLVVGGDLGDQQRPPRPSVRPCRGRRRGRGSPTAPPRAATPPGAARPPPAATDPVGSGVAGPGCGPRGRTRRTRPTGPGWCCGR